MYDFINNFQVAFSMVSEDMDLKSCKSWIALSLIAVVTERVRNKGNPLQKFDISQIYQTHLRSY